MALNDKFQSTQPSQAVTRYAIFQKLSWGISIHTALAGCDEGVTHTVSNNGISIHTALAGCDLLDICPVTFIDDFNPHSPRRL